jgi:uncharacterized membrane protein
MGLELLGLLGGVVTRLITWGAEYFTTKQTNAHELALVEKQIALANVQHAQKLEEISVQTDSTIDLEWAKTLSVALTPPTTGVGFIDGLNALVRPILTFWWALVLYSVSKGFLIYAAIAEHLPAKVLATVVTTEFDVAVIGSILGFWFTDRQLRKFTNGK